MTKQDAAREVARKAKRIIPLMGRAMEAQMRTPALPLPPVHFHVLNRVEIQPHTLNELADAMSVSSASMSRTVTVLEERGWLSRTRSTEDRRLVQIELTSEGHQVLQNIESRTEDFLTQVLEQLPDEKLDTLREGMDILIGAFANQLTAVPTDSLEDQE